MSRGLLILWIATMAADRIDLLGGAGPLMLRPLLLLIPPLLVIESVRLAQRDRILVLPPSAAIFFAGQTILLSLLLLSVIFSRELGLGMQRFALLAFESYAAFLAVIFLLNRPDAGKVLLRGAQLGLALIALFNVVQVSRWVGGPAFAWLELGGIIDLAPATYGPWLPRPSGVSLDPNRGGLAIIIYVAVIAAVAAPSRSRSTLIFLGAVLLLATLSRSAILAAGTVIVVSLLRRSTRFSHGGVALTTAALAIGLAGLLVIPAAREAVLDLAAVLGRRLSIAEGSSSVHFSLLARGWEISTDSVRNALLGIGFGNSYLVLQDFFPGTKYGNFHSAYMSLLVEAGAGALATFLGLMLRPLIRTSDYTPLVAGILVFNVFYQAHVDALLWFVVALAWVLPDLASTGRHRAPERPDHFAARSGPYAGALTIP